MNRLNSDRLLLLMNVLISFALVHVVFFNANTVRAPTPVLNTVTTSTRRNLANHNFKRIFLIKDMAIWMKGTSSVLYSGDRLVFEDSTAMYLSISLFLNDQRYNGSNFSLQVAIVDQGADQGGKGYSDDLDIPLPVMCDFLITIDDPNIPSPIEVQRMLMDLLNKSFNDSKFLEPFLHLLGISSPAFQHITDVSLTDLNPEPRLPPSSSLKQFKLDRILLDFFEINKLSQFEKKLFEVAIREFLLDELESELGFTSYEKIHLELSDEFFSISSKRSSK